LTIDTASEAKDWSRYIAMHRESLDRSDLKEVMEAMRGGDLARAEEHCRTLINESGGTDATLWGVLALYHMIRGDFKPALDAIDRAMELEPEELFIVNLAGDFFSFNNDFKNAETFYLLSLEINSYQLHPRVMLSNRYNAYEMYDEAIGVVLPLLDNYPNDENVWLNLRVALGNLPSKKRQKKIAHRLLKDHPNQYHAWCAMANSLMRRMKLDAALKYCKKAVAVRENDTLAWNMYSTLLSMQGKHKAALICQKKSYELTGDIPSAMASLSTTHYLAGEKEEAMRIIAELERISPEEAALIMGHIEEYEQDKKGSRRRKGERRRK